MPDKEVYSEQEVAAIMKRAAELQEQTADSYVPGVTKDELRAVAGDVGIQPEYLERAILDLQNNKSQKGAIGLTQEFQRVVDYELRPEDFDLLLGGLSSAGRRNPVKQVGRTLQGNVWHRGSMLHLTATSRNGRTKIEVKSTPFTAYLTTLHPLVILTAISFPNVMHYAGGPAWVLAIYALVWLLTGFAFKWMLEKGHRDAKDLADTLQKKVREEGDRVRNNLAAASEPTVEEPKPVQLNI